MAIDSEKLANVLVAEDNRGDIVLLKLLMEGENINFTLHHAEDGDATYEFLIRTGKYSDAPKPDLIFLDVNMPKRDGHEIGSFVKNNDQLKDTPICMLSGSDAIKDTDTAKASGITCYLTKPLTPEKLREVVEATDCLHFKEDGDQVHLCRN